MHIFDDVLRPLVRRGSLAVLVLGAACSGSDGPADPIDPVPATIVVSGAPASLSALGDTVRLNATVRNSDGGIITTLDVVWESSTPSVATVSGEGLVTAVGNGEAEIVASIDDVSGATDVRVAQVARGIRFSPDPVHFPSVGDTATLRTVLVDANDNVMDAVDATWSSGDPSVVLVDPSGFATAALEGQAVLTAEADGFSGEMAALVGEDGVVISSVNPAPMVEGGETVIRGFGFAPTAADNVVSLGGAPVALTTASSVELRLTVPEGACEPARSAEVRVDARGSSDTEPAQILPAEPILALEVGEAAFTRTHCLHLSEGEGGDEYLVGVLSLAEAPSSLTSARLSTRTGSVVATTESRLDTRAARRSPSTFGTFRLPVDPAVLDADAARSPAGPSGGISLEYDDLRSGEARVRAAERAWIESLGVITPRFPVAGSGPVAAGPARAVPVLGDTLELNVPGNSCSLSQGAQVRAVVRHVGTEAVFLDDVENPSGGFTSAEYAEMAEQLAETTLPILNENFGTFADVDDNDRVLILVTKEVNERPNLAGFVFGGDLVGLVGGATCEVSNDAEIFYGIAPDPNGVHGPVRTKADVLSRYPPLIAHELTHVIQFTTFFSLGIPTKSTWELEGGATLAEQLVGYEILGDGPRRDLGFAEWQAGNDPDWYRDWVVDMALYFGLQQDQGQNLFKVADAPERCSWTGFASQGNDGPCDVTRAPYGVPSTLLRWILDHYGESFPGGDAAMMREMTRSNTVGLRTLEVATGLDEAEILSRFAATLWADGRIGDWYPSWNIREVFDNIVPEGRLLPDTSSVAAPTQRVAVRATSSSYLEWTPPSPHPPSSLRIRDTLGDGPLPDFMLIWVVRVR